MGYIRSVLTRDDYTALVVECTAEYLVRVSFQDLQTLAGQRVPQSGCLVRARCQDLTPLRVEGDLG